MITSEVLKIEKNISETESEILYVLICETEYESKFHLNIFKYEIQVTPLCLIKSTGTNIFRHKFDKTTADVYSAFDIEIDKEKQIAKLFHWDIILPKEIRGNGIGSYVVCKLINEGQKSSPDAIVSSIKLSRVDAETDKDRDIRNKFYQNIGFELDLDSDRRYGKTKKVKLSSLKSEAKKDNFTVLSPGAFAMELNENISNLEFKYDHLAYKYNDLLNTNNETLLVKNKYRNVFISALAISGISLYITYLF